MSEDDEKTGYGRPPKHSRFKKGKSGNPKGRPKESRNLATDLKHALEEKITVREGGKTRRVTKRQALLMALVAKGLGGDVKAGLAIVLLDNRVYPPTPKGNDDFTAQDAEILEMFGPKLLKKFLKKQGDK